MTMNSASGVDYGKLDGFKLLAQQLAASTNGNSSRLGFDFLESSRGESVAVFRSGRLFYGHVEEGLGTKVLITEAVLKELGENYFGAVAQDTVAMIVNDMITLGILPMSIAMHVAVGDDNWLTNEARIRPLLEGWKHACDLARCVWSCGETPKLRDIVMPGTAVLSGSAFGVTDVVFNPNAVSANDAIILLTSSGLHANGATACRDLATSLPDGYRTLLRNEHSFGEALLQPTHIYVDFIEDCIRADVNIHYGVNITGHGLRKIMRLQRPLRYVLDHLCPVHPVFSFIQEKTGKSDRDMYASYNMGNGFALFVPQNQVGKLKSVFAKCNRPYSLEIAGYIEEGPRSVVIAQKSITYEGSDLEIR